MLFVGSGFCPLINLLKGLFEKPEPASRVLPAFAESPLRKGKDECEKGIHRSLGKGGSASAGSAEDVKMPRAAARGASPMLRSALHISVKAI